MLHSHTVCGGLVTCTHTHTHLYVSLPWPKWKHVCLCVRVLPPITAHPSRLPVDIARTAEFVSGVEAGRRSDAGVGGLLYTGPPSSSCQINPSLAEWFGERDIPPSLTLSLSAFSPPLSVCLSVWASSRSHTSQQQTQKATPGLHLPTGHEQHCHLENPLLYLWYFWRWGHFSVSAPDPNMSSFSFFPPILWKCSNCEVKSGPSLVCLFVFLLYVSDCKSNPDAVASAEGLHVTHAHGSTYAHTHAQVNVAHKCR